MANSELIVPEQASIVKTNINSTPVGLLVSLAPVSPNGQRGCGPKPRVARHELPWVIGLEPPQPQRGCGPCAPAREPGLVHNAVGVVCTSEREPKVGAG